MNYIIENASPKDKEEILALYNIQKGREFCPWDEHYPTMNEVEFDLSRDSLFIIRDNGQIIAAASIDYDEQVEFLKQYILMMRENHRIRKERKQQRKKNNSTI